MSEVKDQIESPWGLDLNPSPPPTARISKKVGLVAVGIVLVVGTLVVYGLYTRKEQQTVSRPASESSHRKNDYGWRLFERSNRLSLRLRRYGAIRQSMRGFLPLLGLIR